MAGALITHETVRSDAGVSGYITDGGHGATFGNCGQGYARPTI